MCRRCRWRNGTTTVAVTELASGSAFNARGEDYSDRDNAGRETRTIDDDAGRTVETIENYDVGESGQPVEEADLNLVSATTYHVSQQIASDATPSPYTGSAIDVSDGAVFHFDVRTDPATGDFVPPNGPMFVMYVPDFHAFVLARYDNSGWNMRVSGATAWTSLTATASDVLVASVVFSGGGGATVTALAGSAGIFEGVHARLPIGHVFGDVNRELHVTPSRQPQHPPKAWYVPHGRCHPYSKIESGRDNF